ncbi:MAG: exodeoxyribonuclease V subunit gamma [Labilithrix sp.]|nr:exodeoxyribonuclease V subunit gamma [Labilithrix sp.]MCW5816969.1 exodeoxyribonuclease V subunit gamma [Labilithrix sp.]
MASVTFQSSSAEERIARAASWLAARADEHVTIVAASLEAAGEVARRAVVLRANPASPDAAPVGARLGVRATPASPDAASVGARLGVRGNPASPDAAPVGARLGVRGNAALGWQRATLASIAAARARVELARLGLVPASPLALEAICARVVHDHAGALGRLAPIADRPGLPRALARTLGELRLAKVEHVADADLAALLRAYETELAAAHLADRAQTLAIATRLTRSAAATTPPNQEHHKADDATSRTTAAAGADTNAAGTGTRRALLLVDLALEHAAERDFVAALVADSVDTLAVVPMGDERALALTQAALGSTTVERPAAAARPPLAYLGDGLFEAAPAAGVVPADAVTVLSAPGESRECVEIARIVLAEASRGTPLDRMAVLLRAPAYGAHVAEAFRRARVPTFFARGSKRPDPSGRAFLALLACAHEGLSAARFAEYLSLGEVPAEEASGAPPPPRPRAERVAVPDEDTLRGMTGAGAGAATDDAPTEPPPTPPADAEEDRAVAGGTLRAPRHWERLLVEASVIGSAERWESRLAGLAKKLEADVEAYRRKDEDNLAEGSARELAALEALRRFALPLIHDLDALPNRVPTKVPLVTGAANAAQSPAPGDEQRPPASTLVTGAANAARSAPVFGGPGDEQGVPASTLVTGAANAARSAPVFGGPGDEQGVPASTLVTEAANAARSAPVFGGPGDEQGVSGAKPLTMKASWSQWLDALTALATRALRHPDRVLSVLAELQPMGRVADIDIAEVRLVLEPRLSQLRVPETGRRHGKVFVATTDEARGLSFDVVFVPGLAEKIFPQKVVEDPLLLDEARARLSPDLATNKERTDRERLALRLAIGAATRRVVISYPRVDVEQARPRTPSFYGLEVLRVAEGRLGDFEHLAQRAAATAEARIGWPAPRDRSDAIDEAEYDLALLDDVLQKPESEGEGHYLVGAADVNPHLARALRFRFARWDGSQMTRSDGFVKPAEAAKLAIADHATTKRSFSPTALQNFAACPYRFFLSAVHKLAPREEQEAIEEMDALTRGSLTHDVLFRLLTELAAEGRLPIKTSSLDAVRDRLEVVLRDTAAKYKDDLKPAIDRVWDDAVASIAADLREQVRRMAEETEWIPAHFELSFGLKDRRAQDTKSTDEPVAIDGGLLLRGSIDLVERKKNGALRAMDYKTGKVRAKDEMIIGGGETLQPVFYALTLEKLFPGARVEEGVLYYCTSTGDFKQVPVRLDDDARAAAKLVAKTIGDALANGFLPAAPKIEKKGSACTWCDFKPICGPYEEVRTKKKPEVGPLKALAQLRKQR